MAAIRLCRTLPGVSSKTFWSRQFAGTPIPTGIPADPAIHAAGKLNDEDEIPSSATATKPGRTGHSSDPIIKMNRPLSSPKLESTPVNQPIDPKTQQKRTNSTIPIDQVSCVGIDGFPPADTESGRHDRDRDRKEQELDDKEYFKHHKASPLSEIEIADTRKPVTQATDSKYRSGDGGIITWLPEQLVSADETLRRASEIFKQNAMRGDPESPHGRVLRELRGEWW